MYKVQPYIKDNKEQYHLLDCNNNYSIVPEADKFFEFNTLRNFSPCSLQAYAYDLMHYYNYCNIKHIDPLHLGDNRQIMETFTGFAKYLLTDKKNIRIIDKPARKATTVNRIMSTIYNYYRYLSYCNLCDMPDIFATRITHQRNFLSEMVKSKVSNYNLFRFKTDKNSIKYITREQYQLLLTACITLRDKIIVALLFEGGLRRGEVCGIHIDDLAELDHGIIKIVPRDDNKNHARVKNLAAGEIRIPNYVVNMITDYLTTRKGQSDYLFTVTKGATTGEPITTKTVTNLFIFLTHRTGIKVHPHMLRHGFAVEKLSSGWELFEIQSYLRHKVPTSTALYAEFTDQAKIKRMEDFYKSHNIETGEYDYALDDD